MRRLFSFILLILLATGCSPAAGLPVTPTNLPLPSQTAAATPVTPTPASVTPTPTSTATATFTPTPVPCDPAVKYCIVAGHFFLDRPIALPGTITIDPSYPYGSTEGGTRDPHHGVEFYNGSGTPVLAAADGRVVLAGSDSQELVGPRLNFYGNLIVIQHSFPGILQPVFTLYGHLSKIEVQPGQSVQSGQEIGLVGATGEAIGSHLHFEVRLGQDDYASNRNPVLWLKPLNGQPGLPYGVIAGRVMDPQGQDLTATNINIKYFANANQAVTRTYYVDTYAPEAVPVNGDEAWNENFSLGDIPAGTYAISLYSNGSYYDRQVTVEPGQLTLVTFKVGK